MAIARGTQRTYLKERLDRINRSQNTYWGGDDVKLPVPIAVSEAQQRILRDSKIVDNFRKKEKKATETRNARKRKMAEDCRRAIEFEDSKKALALIDRFERTKF